MTKLMFAAAALVLLVAGYAIWPLASAYQIKQAIHAGDVATLERKVHWAPVRASLKDSLAALSPAMQISGDESRLAHGQPMPSIWQRIKAAAAPVMADRFIDTYVTAEGMARLNEIRNGAVMSMLGFAPPQAQVPPARRRWFSRAKPATLTTDVLASQDAPDPQDTSVPQDSIDAEVISVAMSKLSRFMDFYNRIARARFHSLSVAEFEVVDRNNADRRIISQFHLSDFEWKLASVRIIGAGF